MSEDVVEETYKIRHTQSGRFSNGMPRPTFTRNGKQFSGLEDLKQHLKVAGRNQAYAECDLIVIRRRIVQDEEVVGIDQYIDGLSDVNKKRREEARNKQETREKADRRKAYELLRKEFEETDKV